VLKWGDRNSKSDTFHVVDKKAEFVGNLKLNEIHGEKSRSIYIEVYDAKKKSEIGFVKLKKDILRPNELLKKSEIMYGDNEKVVGTLAFSMTYN
jgi:hypothetical protein